MANSKTRNNVNKIPDDAMIIEGDDNDSEKQKAADRLLFIRKRFATMYSFWSPIHELGTEDDRMIAGDQWPEAIRASRTEDKRPVLTYNLLPAFVRQIINPLRESTPQIKIIPVDSREGKSPQIANLAGTKDYSMADVYSGIIKNIEHVSRAKQAYISAVTDQVRHGFGYFYLMNEWSELDPFVQELRIHRVKDSYSVLLDPSAQEVDYRDMNDAFMFSRMKKEVFESKYPGCDTSSFGSSAEGMYRHWFDSDSVMIAQYFYIDYQDDEVVKLNTGTTHYFSDIKDVLDEMEKKEGTHILIENGKEVRKKVKRRVCMWQKMTGDSVLEGPIELPFSAVPIFPVLGEEIISNQDCRYESAIRHAIDPQRSYNYFRTAAAETVGLSPKAPWLLTPKMIEGHKRGYEQANNRNVPYLLFNPDPKLPGDKPGRIFNNATAAAELSNATQDASDMQAIIGLHDASLGRQSNEKSGKAILARQQQGSISTFQFTDNLSRALEQMARCAVEAIPQITDTQRIMRIRLPDDTEDFVEINKSVRDEESNEDILVHDIGYGKYDAVIDVTQNYATQRQEAADMQMELLKVLGPEKSSNIVHLIVKNLGVPGSQEVARVLRKMLPDDLKSEEEKQADLPRGVTSDENGQLVKDGQPYSPPPTIDQQQRQKQQQLEETEQNVRKAEAESKMAKSEAEKATAQAKIEEQKVKLKVVEKELAELSLSQNPGHDAGNPERDAVMMKEINSIIQNAFKEHEVNPQAHNAAVEGAVADAIVDAMKRIKRYVDSAKPESSINEGKEPAKSAVKNVTVKVESKTPGKIEFDVDDEGNITAATPVYDEKPENE